MKSKIRIMNVRPEIPEEEIRSYMDFDIVLRHHREALALRNKNTFIKNTLIALLISGAILSTWIVLTRESVPLKKESAKSPVIKSEPSPAVVSSDSVTSEEKVVIKKPQTPSLVKPQIQTPLSKDSSFISKEKEEKEKDMDPVYSQAEPVDGYPQLYTYFASELKYPQEAMADSVQGVVTVVFTINTEGKPEKISIEQSLGEAFDREAIRVIANMPAWKPASFNGKPVASRISLPLTFKIKTLKEKNHE